MFSWLKELLEIRAEYAERKNNLRYCESCETLRIQLSIANEEKKQLLLRLITPIGDVVKINSEDLKPIQTTHRFPWKVRQQMLEAEDRERAKKIKENMESQTTSKANVEELEKELDVVESERQEEGVK